MVAFVETDKSKSVHSNRIGVLFSLAAQEHIGFTLKINTVKLVSTKVKSCQIKNQFRNMKEHIPMNSMTAH